MICKKLTNEIWKKTAMRFIFIEESTDEVPKRLVLDLILFKYFIRDLAQKCQCDNEIY